MWVCMSIRKREEREEREGEGEEGVEAGQQGWRRSRVAAGAMVIFLGCFFCLDSKVVDLFFGWEGCCSGGRISNSTAGRRRFWINS